jgi:hypothetical protein
VTFAHTPLEKVWADSGASWAVWASARKKERGREVGCGPGRVRERVFSIFFQNLFSILFQNSFGYLKYV